MLHSVARACARVRVGVCARAHTPTPGLRRPHDARAAGAGQCVELLVHVSSCDVAPSVRRRVLHALAATECTRSEVAAAAHGAPGDEDAIAAALAELATSRASPDGAARCANAFPVCGAFNVCKPVCARRTQVPAEGGRVGRVRCVRDSNMHFPYA